ARCLRSVRYFVPPQTQSKSLWPGRSKAKECLASLTAHRQKASKHRATSPGGTISCVRSVTSASAGPELAYPLVRVVRRFSPGSPAHAPPWRVCWGGSAAFAATRRDYSCCPVRGPEGPHYPCKPDTSIAELLWPHSSLYRPKIPAILPASAGLLCFWGSFGWSGPARLH